MTPRRATQRYRRDFWIAIGVYVALVFVVPFVLRQHEITGLALVALAVLPALPLLRVIYVMGRYLMETDEYQRALQTRRMLGALGAMLGICTVYGFIETFAGAPHFELYHVFPLFCVLYGASCLVVRSPK